MADEIRKISTRNGFQRALHYNDDGNTIRAQVQRITWSIENFTVRSLAYSWFFLNLYDLLQVETMLAIEFALDVC